MTNHQKNYIGMGNKSLSSIWESIENRIDFQNTPEYDEMTTVLYNLLEKIQDEDLKNTIVEVSTSYSNLAMYQGFVLGFREAVEHLTCKPKRKVSLEEAIREAEGVN